MCIVVGLLHVGEGEMRVDLGRLQGSVPKELLDGIDFCAVVKKRSGECMAEGVGTLVGGSCREEQIMDNSIDSPAI